MNWEFVKLSEACKFLNGGTPSRNVERYFDGNIPWITGADISEEQDIVIDSRFFITEEAIESSATKVVPKGNILLVSRTGVGKVAITGVDMCISQDFTGIVPDKSRIDVRYLFRFLQSRKQYFVNHQRGATIQGITRQVIAELQIPLPPLAEQQRIAAILDQADALRTKRRAALAKLDTLLQATFLDMFGDPVTNPMGWEVKPLGEVTDVKTGSTPSREHEGNYGGIVPWVKTTEVNWGTITQTEETVSKQGIKSARLKTYPKNSILIAMYGQGKTRGKSAVLGIDATVNQACAVLLPTNKFETEYIAVLLKHSYETIRNLGRGGNQPNLNLELVKSFQIPLPPVELQNDFSKIIKKIYRLLENCNNHLKHQDSLFHALQQRAFQGEL